MSEKSYTAWYFLLFVVLIYLIVAFFRAEAVMPSLEFSWSIVVKIIPVFILVFAVMVITNYYITPANVSKYLGKSSGIKKWLIAVAGGIISTGPIYMWYPMLKELKSKGVKYGFIATFLYSRAIKPPMIPMIIFYFGLEFTVILTIVMIVMSIIQGMIFEKIEQGGFL